MEEQLTADRFPRASRYHPEWILAGVSGAANSLWLTEWLTEEMELQPGMRVLDLGCGRALSSIFLHREFGVQVWAADLWFNPAENCQRVQDAGAAEGVFPLRAEARSLPFAEEFFDAIVSIDSFMYYGTDDLYLNYLARFVKPGGQIGIALAGLEREVDGSPPEYLAEWWAADPLYCLHSAAWWRRHWERSGLVDVELADSLADGWQYWRRWVQTIAPANEVELRAIEADAGRYVGYVRAIGRRREGIPLMDPCLSIPAEYMAKPLLRE
ncbi:SAM-dependent methyltransferase [Lacipirellula sp.]|uniref:SAM-dependent methyltransferase n=1 Tax=Lacipirellula sp. TaxID=2691419 RepID=UPI003D0F4BFE